MQTALAEQKICYLKQWTIEIRQQLLFLCARIVARLGQVSPAAGIVSLQINSSGIAPDVYYLAICLLLVRGLGDRQTGAEFENFLMAVNCPRTFVVSNQRSSV
jgi:hypothetical protein